MKSTHGPGFRHFFVVQKMQDFRHKRALEQADSKQDGVSGILFVVFETTRVVEESLILREVSKTTKIVEK